MFETNTYEAILQRLLDRIPDTMDKREGAVIYDALAPAAIELNLAYIALEYLLKQILQIRQTGSIWYGRRGRGM